MNIYIGIDVGTTSVKTTAIGENGERLGSAKRAYELHTNGGLEVTQSADDWWTATAGSVRELTKKLACVESNGAGASRVRAISISAQGGSTPAVDADGNAMTEAMTWMDKRAFAESDELTSHFTADGLYRSFGWRATPGCDAAKLLWLKKHRPEIFEKAASFPSTLGWINLKLTGKNVEDPTCAAIRRLYDINNDLMSREMLDYIGIDEGRLPKILPTGAFVGYLTDGAAETLGLDKSVAVFNGAHDQYCASLGSGISGSGELLLATGTAWVLFGVTEKPLFTASYISPGRHPTGKFGALATVSGFGATFEWLSALTATPLAELSRGAEADGRREKDRSIMFRPFVSGTGLLCGANGGTLDGLGINSDKYDLALTLMEGAAFETRLVIDEFRKSGMKDMKKLTMTGGATASTLWQRLVAATADIPLYVSPETNSPATGAAVLAAAGYNGMEKCGEYSGRFALPGECVIPDQGFSDFYRGKLDDYLKWCRAL